MQSSEDKSLPSIAVFLGVAAVFESRAWLDFVAREISGFSNKDIDRTFEVR